MTNTIGIKFREGKDGTGWLTDQKLVLQQSVEQIGHRLLSRPIAPVTTQCRDSANEAYTVKHSAHQPSLRLLDTHIGEPQSQQHTTRTRYHNR